jgi:PST family polysaccharide transporter
MAIDAVGIEEVRSQARSGAKFVLALRGLNFAVSFAATVILARLLLPREFGLAAMAMFLLSFLATFRDVGLATVTIQREAVTTSDLTALFWLNLIVTSLLAFAAALSSPLVAAFYEQPLVASVLYVLCFSFMIAGAAAQHLAMLRREMRFDALLIAEGSGLLVGLVAGTVLAYVRRDVWALVGMTLVQSIVTSGLIVAQSRWRPGLPDFKREHMSFIGFGANVTAFSALNFLSNNLGAIILGHLSGPAALGHFTRAQQLFALPATAVIHPLMQVIFPMLCRFKGNGAEYRDVYVSVIARISMFLLPAAVVLPLVSADVVLVLFGPTWSEAGPVLAWFAPALMALGMVLPFGYLMMSQGRVKELRMWGVADLLIRGGGAGIGAFFGPVGAAAGFSLTTFFIAAPLIVALTSRRGPVRVSDQLRAVLPAWGLAGCTFAAAFAGVFTVDSMALPVGLPSLTVKTGFGFLGWFAGCLSASSTRRTLFDLVRSTLAFR